MMHSSCDGDDETHATAKTALILPNFSPVAWLQQDSWASMSRHEKESFLEHITEGRFQNDRHLSVHDRYYATPSLFSKDVIEFGNGVDRVVLGHGPRRVLILTGIHGNEPCGVEAVKMILRKLFTGSNSNVTSEELFQDENWAVPLETLLDSLTIEFLLGNPAALQQNRRFLIRNLNRLFDINKLCDSELADREGYRYELHRARLITESIRHADFVLDIHSCSSDVGAFALPSSLDLSECLAEHLPVKYVIESLVHACLDGGTTLDAAMWNDVPGVCVECGQHRHKDVGEYHST
jgi:predicted deacylase